MPELPAVSSPSGSGLILSTATASLPHLPIHVLGPLLIPRLCLDQDALPFPPHFSDLGSVSFRPISFSITFSYFIRVQESHGCRLWTVPDDHTSVMNNCRKGFGL